jgi:hypothetical protein
MLKYDKWFNRILRKSGLVGNDNPKPENRQPMSANMVDAVR